MNIFKIIYLILSIIGGALIGYNLVGNKNLTLIIIGVVLVVLSIVLDIIDAKFIKHKNVKKNRTTLYIPYTCENSVVENTIKQNLSENSFELVKYGEEEVYKKGKGFFSAQKMLTYKLDNSKVILDCWISLGMGNNPDIELPLDQKFLAAIPKRQLKKVVDNLIKQIEELKNSN